MNKTINAKDIPREIKAALPIIPHDLSNERFCTSCRYYAGVYMKARRCMLKKCGWEDESEKFHPALLMMYSRTLKELEKLESVYLQKKVTFEILQQMKDEQEQESKVKQDECYQCKLQKQRPCVGICYAKISTIKKEGEQNE